MGSLSYETEVSPHHLSALSPRLSLSGPMGSAYWLEPGFPRAQYAAFLGSLGSSNSASKCQPPSPLGLMLVVCPYRVLTKHPTGLDTVARARPTLLRPRLRQRRPWWCRNTLVHALPSPPPLAGPPARAAFPVISWGTYPPIAASALILRRTGPSSVLQRLDFE
jgi:hypothetical protein